MVEGPFRKILSPLPVKFEAYFDEPPTDGRLGRCWQIKIDAHSIMVGFYHFIARFNKRLEVSDPSGRSLTVVDIGGHVGDLAPLWKLVNIEGAALEMDAQSFRVRLADGSVIRSQNILDSRQPDLAQVEFWRPLPQRYPEPRTPEEIQRYPAIIANQ
jgi:hypothetical protein